MYEYTTIEYHFGPEGKSGILEPTWLKIMLHHTDGRPVAYTKLRTPNIDVA